MPLCTVVIGEFEEDSMVNKLVVTEYDTVETASQGSNNNV